MTVGTKEYYLDGFKHFLMTNLVIEDAQSLTSVHACYAAQIDTMSTLHVDEKKLCLHNLEKALQTILHEVLGQPEEKE